jgi:hypothetical protein
MDMAVITAWDAADAAITMAGLAGVDIITAGLAAGIAAGAN